MKIDKAIEALNDILTFVHPGDPPEEHEAIKLGIEALKHIKRGRSCRGNYIDNLLAGETK